MTLLCRAGALLLPVFAAAQIVGSHTLVVSDAPADDDSVRLAEARRAIEAGNAAWGRARVAVDQAAFERTLAPDFYAQLPGRRLSRSEFIERITRYAYGRVTRFDPIVLTVQREGNAWVAVVLERIEYDRTGSAGSTTRGYMLAVTRDGWLPSGDGWQVLFTELLGVQTWHEGAPPPLALW